MAIVHRTPVFTLTADPAAELSADFLVVPYFEDDDFGDVRALAGAGVEEIARGRTRRELAAKLL